MTKTTPGGLTACKEKGRKELCKLLKTFLRHPTDRNKERYRVKHAEYKKHCDIAKRISWADYKEKINSVEAANTFRKIIETSQDTHWAH